MRIAKNIILPISISILSSSILMGVGCSSSSSSSDDDEISAQAVDGYIVGGTVYCDGIENGGSAAAGRMTCPEGTLLMSVEGGTDVGFDATKTSGEYAFIGRLTAPGTLKYVTPLSTVAVAMSIVSGDFQAGRFADSVAMLSASLGLSDLDLNQDATKSLQLVRLNAQFHQLLSGFSTTTEDYVSVSKALAQVVLDRTSASTTINVSSHVSDIVAAINSVLASSNPGLSLNKEDLDTLSADIQAANEQIEMSSQIESVSAAAMAGSDRSVLAINRDLAPVIFTNEYGYAAIPLKLYEIATLYDGYHFSRLNVNEYYGIKKIHFGAKAFDVYKSLENAKIGLGFEIRSTKADDPRVVAITTSDALLTMTKGVTKSIQMKLPDMAQFHAKWTDSQGVTSSATFEISGEKVFNGINGNIGINFDVLGAEMEKRGYEDITRSTGNFRTTFVISGIHVNMFDSDEEYRAMTYSVDTGATAITGSGFQGYVSLNGYY